jgi:hypothetical protein
VSEGGHLLGGSSLAACDDRTGMSHTPPWWGSLTGNESHDGLLEALPDKHGGFFFGGPANLPNHHDGVCFLIGVKEPEYVNESRANQGIAANPNAG